MGATRKFNPVGTIRPGYETKVYNYSNSNRSRNRKNKDTMSAYSNRPKNAKNFFMSPLYTTKFSYGGTVFNSVIQYVESQKYNKQPIYQPLILAAQTPGEALLLGKANYLPNNSNDPLIDEINTKILHYSLPYDQTEWKTRRDTHFRYATYCKFDQNPELKEALMDTYPSPIIEETHDPYWGIGRVNRNGTFTGLNMAGKHLASVRDYFIEQCKKESVNKESVK